MRTFEITWYKNERNPIERKNRVLVTRPTGTIEKDAKYAVGLFTSEFGSLKKNSIISIAEVDKDGNQIGELITPMDGENAIVPTGS